MTKLLELARKLKALSDRGVGGEQINAERLLNKIMQENDITPDDLEHSKRDFEVFIYKYHHKTIFRQVVHMVMNKEYKAYQVPGKRNACQLEVTSAELLEIKATFDFYQKSFDKDYRTFVHAFVQRNKLFPESVKAKSLEDLSEAELLHAKSVLKMSGAMKEHVMHKQIEEKS